MAKNPQRNWGVLYHNGWMIKLKEHLVRRDAVSQPNAVGKSAKSVKMKVCWRYNKNKGNCGSSCRFKHRCLKCGKMGHPGLNCHKNAKEKVENKHE